jgi:hypothetical protein
VDRRNFLRFLGLGAAAAVAPTKAYSFLGGILRPRKEVWTPVLRTEVLTLAEVVRRWGPSERERVDQMLYLITNPPWIGVVDDIPWKEPVS